MNQNSYPIYSEQQLRVTLRNAFGYEKEARIDAIITQVKASDTPVYINRNLKNKYYGILKLFYKADINSFILENKGYASISQARKHGF